MSATFVERWVGCPWLGKLNLKNRLIVAWLWARGYQKIPQSYAMSSSEFDSLFEYSEYPTRKELTAALNYLCDWDSGVKQ